MEGRDGMREVGKNWSCIVIEHSTFRINNDEESSIEVSLLLRNRSNDDSEGRVRGYWRRRMNK